MQATSIAPDVQEKERHVTHRINAFFQQFKIGTLAHRCGITKAKGISPTTILLCLFSLPFQRLNLYRYFSTDGAPEFGKDAVYEFMRSSRFSWRRFLLLVATHACGMLSALTSEKRETVLILDDSTFQRPRSKKVELLARVFDHTGNCFLKGFRLFSLCWSDGATLVPLDFALLSSTKEKNRYQGVTKQLDSRSCGAKRRQEAVCKSTSLIAPMLQRALAAGIKAKYLLMDSWFGMPSIISKAREHLPVICMIKRTPKIHYGFDGTWLSVDSIHARLRKRRGLAKILGSALVTMNDGKPARIVFVRNKHKKDWLALLSTDIKLPEAEVVRIYGKRWDIEVFFRTTKQHLDLEKGCQARDFDALIAHTTIVMLRYIFLAMEQRRHDDPRTLGLLFHACCDEVRDLEYLEALQRILTLTMLHLQENKQVAEELCQAIMADVLQRAFYLFGLNRRNCQRSKGVES